MPRRLSEFWDELVACRDDTKLLLEVIARRAAEVVGEASVLTTVSGDGRQLIPVAIHHADPEVVDFIWTVMGSAPYEMGEGLAGAVASSREPVVLAHIDADSSAGMHPTHVSKFRERHVIHAVMIVPMIAYGSVVGTLGVVRIDSDEPYRDEDMTVLEALAERAALALADATRRPAPLGPAEHEAIFRQSVDGILFTIPDGRILAANPAACEILQRTEQEICRLGRAGLLVAEDPRTQAAVAQRALSGKVRAEVPMIRGNGDVFIADMSSTVFTANDGTVRTSVIFRDATSRVLAQEQLAIQHRYLELLHDVTTAVNDAADVDSAIDYALRVVCAATDWPLGDALLVSDDGALKPTSAWYLADPERFRWFRRGMQRSVLLSGEELAGRVVESGSPVWLSDLAADDPLGRGTQAENTRLRSYLGVPIMAGAEVRGVLEVFSDRSRPRDDQLLAILTDIGTQLGRALERSESEAVRRRVEDDRAAFVARAAHELRSPVSSLVIAAELLAKQPAVDVRGAALRRLVVDSAHHLARLVNRLLDLSEIERGKPALHIERVDVALVVERALAAESAPPGHVVTSDVPYGSLAMVDALSLEQILTNLLRNAFRYGGEQVEITLRRTDDRLLLTVSDNGQGIDPAVEQTMFEPFVRGPSRLAEGSGLGLAVSRRLAEAMGGTLGYERPDGGGSRFVIDLPRGESTPGD
jgi:PAS domain S-box-containing protein